MMTTLNPHSKLYRISTILRSFLALYRLSPKEVDSFVKAYEIYDYDWVDGKATKESGMVDYEEVKKNLLNWYTVINHLCAMGEVEKMYIPPVMDGSKNLIDNQLLFEKQFAHWLNMKKGDKVLELGCGKGRVAAHVASVSGAEITAVNIDQGQLDNATWFANKNGMSNQLHFMNHDFNDLPFPFADNYFDSMYEVQVLSLSRDLDKLCRELYRIIKPGGKISLNEWVRLPGYDPNNAHHRDLLRKMKPLVGAIGTPSVEEYESAMKRAGFEVIVSKDPSVDKYQGPMIDAASRYFDRVSSTINFLAKVKLIPGHFIVLFERLGRDVAALSEADRLGLVSMSYMLIGQKPAK